MKNKLVQNYIKNKLAQGVPVRVVSPHDGKEKITKEVIEVALRKMEENGVSLERPALYYDENIHFVTDEARGYAVSIGLVLVERKDMV